MLNRIEFVLSVLWILFVIYFSSDAAIHFVASHMMLLGAGTITCLWVVRTSRLFRLEELVDGRGATYHEVHFRSKRIRHSSEILLWLRVPAVVLCGIVIANTDFALAARISLSDVALRDYVEGVQIGETRLGRVGLFTVAEVDQIDDCVRLVTCDAFMGDAGFVYSPSGRPRNDDHCSYRHLYGPWWHWFRSAF